MIGALPGVAALIWAARSLRLLLRGCARCPYRRVCHTARPSATLIRKRDARDCRERR